MRDRLDCPFCGRQIVITIGDKCGKEPNGYTGINHYCDSGLSIEYFEEGQDYDTARNVVIGRTYKDYRHG